MLIPTQQNGLSPEELPGVGFTYGLLGEQARRRRVRYRDISELSLVGPVVTVSYVEPPGIGTVDNSDLGGNPSSVTQNLTKTGQSFVLPVDAKIVSIRVWIWQVTATGDITFEIRNDNANHVGPTLLSNIASVSVGNFPSSYGTPTDVPISTADLVGGQKYWILLGKTIADTGSNRIAIPGPVASSYPFGGVVTGPSDGSDPTNAETPGDITFVVTYEVSANVVSLKLTPSGVERVAVFPYFPVIDEFNDASAPRDLSAYNPLWTHNSFDGSNQLKTTIDGGVSALNLISSSAYRSDVLGSDGEVFATVKVKPQDTAWFELLGRMQNPGNTFNAYVLVGFANAGVDQIELWKCVGGSFSTVAVMQTAEYNVGDEFGFRYIGNQISVFKNGVQIGTTQTDNSVTGDGYIGLRMTSNVGILDNFGGGRSGVIATDAATIPLLFTVSAIEAYEQFDAATIPLLFTVSALETREIPDTATTTLLFTSSAVETAQLVDTATEYLALVPSGIELKAIEFTDAATLGIVFTASALEVKETTDAATIPLLFTASATELKARELTDANAGILLFTPSGVEVAGLVDATTIPLIFTPSAIEIKARELTDANIGTILFTPTTVEIGVFVDANTVPLLFTPSAVELKAKELTDATTIPLMFTILVVEAIERVDASTTPLLFTVSGSDIYVIPGAITDAATVPLALTISAVETVTLIDAATARVSFTPSGSEVLVPGAIIIDAATIPIKFTVSGSEVYTPPVTYTDANTVPLALTSSGTEVLVPGVVISDAATAYISLKPSVVEFLVYTDTGFVYLRFRVSGIEEQITPAVDIELTAICFQRYLAECEGVVYTAVVTKQYVAICEGQIYEGIAPYRRWWTRYDSTYQGQHRAFAR